MSITPEAILLEVEHDLLHRILHKQFDKDIILELVEMYNAYKWPKLELSYPVGTRRGCIKMKREDARMPSNKFLKDIFGLKHLIYVAICSWTVFEMDAKTSC